MTTKALLLSALGVFAFSLVASPAAFAAKATKSEESKDQKPAEVAPAAEAKPANEAKPAAEAKKEAAAPAPAVPPQRLSMMGAATLGSGMAMRADLTAGTSRNINNGIVTLGYGMLFGLSQHLDLGFNVRVPLYDLGFSPGISLRWDFLDDTRFHLGLIGSVNVPMKYVPGFWLGVSVEPGVAMSYFMNENVELYSALLFVWAPQFINPWVPGSDHATFAGDFRLGLAYQVTNSRIGFFANLDLSAGYEPVRTFIVLGNRGSGLAFNAAFVVGSQFRF